MMTGRLRAPTQSGEGDLAGVLCFLKQLYRDSASAQVIVKDTAFESDRSGFQVLLWPFLVA